MVPLVMSLIPIPIFDEGCLLRLSQSIDDETAESITTLPLSYATSLPQTATVFLPGRREYLYLKRIVVEESVSDPNFLAAQKLGAQLLQKLFQRVLNGNGNQQSLVCKSQDLRLLLSESIKRVSEVHNHTTEFLNRALGKLSPNLQDSFRFVHSTWDGFVPYALQAKIIETWESDEHYTLYDGNDFCRKVYLEVRSLILSKQFVKAEKALNHAYHLIRASTEPECYYDGALYLQKKVKHLLLKCETPLLNSRSLGAVVDVILSKTQTFKVSTHDLGVKSLHSAIDYTPTHLTFYLAPKAVPESVIEEDSLREVVNKFPRLKHLSIIPDPSHDDQILDNVYDIRSLIFKLKFLEVLNIVHVCSLDIFNECNFFYLRKLNIKCASRSNSQYLDKAFLENCYFPNLRIACLSAKPKLLLVRFLKGILRAAPAIESIDVSCSKNDQSTVSSVAIQVLDKIEKLPYLRYLMIANCPVERSFVNEIISKAPRLEKLKLLSDIKDGGEVVVHNSSIRKLHINKLFFPDCSFSLSSLRTFVIGSLKVSQLQNSSLAFSSYMHITKLVVQNLELADRCDVSYLQLPSVTTAKFESFTSQSDSYIERFPQMPNITDLSIGWDYQSFNNERVYLTNEALSHFPKLTRLHLGIRVHGETEGAPQSLQSVTRVSCTTFEYMADEGYEVDILSNLLLPKVQSLLIVFQYYDNDEAEDISPSYVCWGDNQTFHELYELSFCSFSKVNVLSHIDAYLSSLNAPSLKKIDLSELMVDDFDSDYIWSVARRCFPEIECIIFPLRD